MLLGRACLEPPHQGTEKDPKISSFGACLGRFSDILEVRQAVGDTREGPRRTFSWLLEGAVFASANPKKAALPGVLGLQIQRQSAKTG